jgi:hypothetical protein
MDALVAEAVKAAIGALTKEAVGPALTIGSRVWSWLETKLKGTEALPVVAAVKAEPTKTSARHKLAGALADLLEAQPGLTAELEGLLREGVSRDAVVQTATVTGDQNVSAQTTGRDNTVTIGRT